MTILAQTRPDALPRVAIIGGGPAGLMAAQTLLHSGQPLHIDLFDAMPSVGRKFLLAGKGGLNLTHSEPLATFLTRFGAAQAALTPWLTDWGPAHVRRWAQSLGVETFVGTSGRVFPTTLKAAPLLRAWLHSLRHPPSTVNGGRGVTFHMRQRWVGWTDQGALRLVHPDGETPWLADAVVLALGGASWARLGSDGAWVPLLQDKGIAVTPLQPANCGFDVGWSDFFRQRFAGQPFKSVAIHFEDSQGQVFDRKGEFVATATGVEGSLVYAAAAGLREEVNRQGHATFWLNLLPDKSPAQVLAEVSHPRGSRSLSSHLKSRLSIDGIKSAVLHECVDKATLADPVLLARALQAVPITVKAARPIDEAISTAGGVRSDALDAHGMLRSMPGVFCAGEMLDWEAPTGGYLLSASLASGRAAALGVQDFLAQKASR